MAKHAVVNTQKRRKFYIDSVVQGGFIIKFCSLVGAGSVVMVGLLYLLARFSTTVSIIKSRVVVTSTADFILPLLVQTVVIVTVFVSIATVFMALFVSHKIAGPLYRFKQTFKELGSGNFTNQVRLRKDDQLQEVGGEFNQMITSVRNQVHQAQESLSGIKKDVDAIGDFGIEDTKRKQFTDLKHKLSDLEKALKFFKI
jgi:methyl-accepting chemotaxis protein